MEANTAATPGELLRGARQLYGWSVEEVADELNLLPYIVQALENDDYDQLAGWTYVVGYLRSYGKLVSVNVESGCQTGSSKPEFWCETSSRYLKAATRWTPHVHPLLHPHWCNFHHERSS